MPRKDLAFDRLHALVAYDPETGIFTSRVKRGKLHPGTVLGCVKREMYAGDRGSGAGYVVLSIDRQHHYAHRLAWFYVRGTWPEGQIDHVNGDRADNRVRNLRDVTASQNRMNSHGVRADNVSTGMTGVSPANQDGGFTATIYVRGKRIHLGTFPSALLARSVYRKAKSALHVLPAHGS